MHSLSAHERGIVSPLSGLLLILAVVGIIAVGWRVNDSVAQADASNANASVVSASLRIYQNQVDNNTVNKWNEYSNETLGISFKYPPTWGVAHESSDTDDLFLVLFDNKVTGAPKHFNGELRATSTTAVVSDNATARGYVNKDGLYYRRYDSRPYQDITTDTMAILNSPAGRIVLYEDTSGASALLTGLININGNENFSGLNFTFGSSYDKDDIATFKKVLQTFSIKR